MAKILVIHTDPQLVLTMVDYLSEHYHTEASFGVDHAIKVLKNNPFDVVVTPFDSEMVAAVRACGPAYMICLVESLRPEIEKQLLEMGIEHYLTIPFELESIKLRIDHVLG